QELSAQTLVAGVRQLDGQLAGAMLPLIELAAWGRTLGGSVAQLNRPPEVGPLRWTPGLFPDTLTAQLGKQLQAGERIALRVPVPVRAKGKPVVWSHFDVFLVRDGTEGRGRPVFVREGIIISDVHSPLSRGIRSLVVVEDRPLATLLGDSENPAHTQWQ